VKATIISIWRARVNSAQAVSVHERVHSVVCLFDELLQAYADAVSEIEALTSALDDTKRNLDRAERKVATLTASLHDSMFRETP